jgi:hypothetical protein
MVASPCYIEGMKYQKHSPESDEIELHPDAWERFTEFVKRIAKAGPQHRTKKEHVDEPKRLKGRKPKV